MSRALIPLAEGWVGFAEGPFRGSTGFYVTQKKNIPAAYWAAHSTAYKIGPEAKYEDARHMGLRETPPTRGDCMPSSPPDTWVIIPLFYRESKKTVDPVWGEETL